MNIPSVALRVLLLAATLLALWLVSPFADAVLVALVVAFLCWPARQRVLRRLGDRRVPTTVVSLVGITVGVVVPVSLLFWLVGRELTLLVNQLSSELDDGQTVALVLQLRDLPVVDWWVVRLGGAEALAEQIRTLGREVLGNLGSILSTVVPGLLGFTFMAFLKSIIFFLTLGTLLHSGDLLAIRAVHVSPLRPGNTTRLMEVFAEFARNVVLAGFAASLAQGVVAGVGYLIAGADRPLFFALLTGVMAFVPLVGTAIAWIPVALLLLLHGHPGGALFVVLWSLLVTGTIDNVVKPLVVRGSSEMPTLLVFLGVFGGVLGFGIIGLLVGPVLMAMLLALFRIYEDDVLEAESASPRLAPIIP